jgi:ADP-ribose pyrophosphatase YjhB (NUDIX family)
VAISPHVKALRAKLGSMRIILPSVAALVFDDRGGLLLVRQVDGGVWSTPGGTIELHETPADAVVREVWEETGLEVEIVRIAAVLGGPEYLVRYPNGDETQYVMTAFECSARSGHPRGDGEETLEARYWTPEEAAALPLAPWLRHALPLLIERRAATTFQPARWQPPG